MRNLPLRPLVALVVLVALASTLAQAQYPASMQRQSPPSVYAITNARIVTVSGAVIERGTVVIRDGLIAAVGANVPVPGDARPIDGTGLTVYPGLIDAHTMLGIPATPRPSPAPGGGPPSPLQQAQPVGFSPNSPQPPGLQPEVMAADIIRPGGEQIEAARAAGITAALVAPREGIFIGQSLFANLAGETPQEMIVRSPVALHVGFTPLRGGQFPTSLMGVFAAIRQMLIDAQRYREAQEIYARNPRGLRRPDQDKSLAALLPVLAREMPVVLMANTEREIVRALDLAQEFNLRAVIAGGNEAWRVAPRLRQMNVPVLLSANFPRRTTAPSPEADPEPLRVLRERVETPRGAGRLASAGVRFAFQSGAMTNMADFLTNVGRAVENGLPRDEALRALTIRPAEIFGLADRLGTIETGKIANLTVTRGDLFDRNRQIAHVFIDGRQMDLRPPATTPGAAPAGASGTWTLRAQLTPETTEQFTVTLNLRQEGERLSGALQGDLGSAQIANASISQTGEFRFTAPITVAGGQTLEASFTGTVTGNQMRGTVQVVGRGQGSFEGTRTGGPPGAGTTPPTGAQTAAALPDLTGAWSLAITTGDGGAVDASVTLRQEGSRLTGNFQSPQVGSSELTQGGVSAEGFRFTVTVTVAGQSIDATFIGTATGNQMSGTIATQIGPATFTGTRTP